MSGLLFHGTTTEHLRGQSPQKSATVAVALLRIRMRSDPEVFFGRELNIPVRIVNA